MKIVFTGGGTGGHVFPLIAIIRELKKISRNVECFYIGPRDEFAATFLAYEEVKIKWIFAGKFRRYLTLQSIFQNLIDIFKIPIGFFQTFFYLLFLNPDLIFSKGGYGAILVVISGWILRIPIFIHESDVVPGLVNRISAKFATAIFVSFPKTLYLPQSKMIYVGNPIRTELLTGNREEARQYFKITGEKPVILILGGSQGAQRINDKVLTILTTFLKDFEIIHQTGEKNFKEVEFEVRGTLDEKLRRYYHPFPFLKEDELKKAYSICDLIVARAGSNTIFEIAATGKPSILIPLAESAQNHQLKNAYAFYESGAAKVIEEKNFTPGFFLGIIKFIFSNVEEMERMKTGAKNFAKPLAAKMIAQSIFEFLRNVS